MYPSFGGNTALPSALLAIKHWRSEGPGNKTTWYPPGSNILASMELGSEVRVALKKTDNNCTVTGIPNNPYFYGDITRSQIRQKLTQ